MTAEEDSVLTDWFATVTVFESPESNGRPPFSVSLLCTFAQESFISKACYMGFMVIDMFRYSTFKHRMNIYLEIIQLFTF